MFVVQQRTQLLLSLAQLGSERLRLLHLLLPHSRQRELHLVRV